MQRKKRLITLDILKYKQYIPLVSLSVAFVVGLLLGNLLVCKNSVLTSFAADKFQNELSLFDGNTLLNVIFTSAFSIIPYFLLIFAAGLSIIGIALAPMILICFGFQYGCLSGYLYSTYQLEGIMFSSLVILPSALICLFGLLVLSGDAIKFSLLLASSCVKSCSPVNLYTDLKKYCTRSSATLISAAFAIFADTCMSKLFIGYFNF